MTNAQMLAKIAHNKGFIAALDQSGGSTPKALLAYGINENQYQNTDEMMNLVHKMRERIVTDKSFTGEQVLAAILFEHTLDSTFSGKPAADFLWQEKHIVPFLKVDQGLCEESDGVQLMVPLSRLDNLLDKAIAKHVFGTKMRSVIKSPNKQGIKSLIDQQFSYAKKILSKGLMPIIEPEVDIYAHNKALCEHLLKDALINQLDLLPHEQKVMLKLTLPEQDNLYLDCINHKSVLRVVALSGGYSREQANAKLSKNTQMIASFSRALSQDLNVEQSPQVFSDNLASAINSIYNASS